ncbi:MAG: hypothetical protein K6G10_12130 [Butyrivibrio sp.]|nr:hypothetical protein [Butyrivibrio sp.]
MSNSEGDILSLFKDVRECLLASPEFCYKFSPIHLQECMDAEIGDCFYLFPTEDLSEMKDMADFYVKRVTEAFSKGDSVAAADIVGKMIALLEELPPSGWVKNYNFEHVLNEHREKKTIPVIGDSHVNFYSGNEELTLVSVLNDINTCPNVGERPFSCFHFGPCLAYSSSRHGAQNKALEKTEFLLEKFFEGSEKVVVSMGEIDMRAHVFKQTELQGCTYEKVVDDIFDHYSLYLKMLKDKGHRVYCWAPIATQKDKFPKNQNVFPRYATEADRNRATAYFTEKLRDFCKKEDMVLMSILYDMIDDNYMTEEKYVSTDHWHLGQAAFDKAQSIWKEAGLL